jgi:DNA-binding MarR family transcriptional regulator
MSKSKSWIEHGDKAARERKAKTIMRELLRDAGLTLKMVELHDYCIRNEGWHSSEDLAEHFNVVRHTLFRWAEVLVEKELLDREESQGDEESGGRLPAHLMANRAKSRKSLLVEFEERAQSILKGWTLGKELALKVAE